MDVVNFLTTIALFATVYGTAQVYKGKEHHEGLKLGKGIFSLGAGILGLCWLNPIFPAFPVISLCCSIAITTLLLGFTSDVFSSAGKNNTINVEIINSSTESLPKKETLTIDSDNMSNCKQIPKHSSSAIVPINISTKLKSLFLNKSNR